MSSLLSGETPISAIVKTIQLGNNSNVTSHVLNLLVYCEIIDCEPAGDDDETGCDLIFLQFNLDKWIHKSLDVRPTFTLSCDIPFCERERVLTEEVTDVSSLYIGHCLLLSCTFLPTIF